MAALRTVLSVIFVVLFAAAPSCENLDALFSQYAQIHTEKSGLCRLELGPEVLAHCRSDLADLRVLDANGREVPYLIDCPDPADGLAVQHEAIPKIIAADRSQRAVDRSTIMYREHVKLRLPTLPRGTAFWILRIDSDVKEFVARLDINASTHEGEAVTIISEGSVFRMPTAKAERLDFAIPNPDAAVLDLAIEGSDQGYLKPRFTALAVRNLPFGVSRGVDLPVTTNRDRAGVTDIVVDRPRGLVPRRLRLMTSTPTFTRQVTVWDDGPGAASEALGTSEILRIAAVAPVEKLELPVRAARGDQLRILIDNRGSPPLEDLRVEALVASPVLLFSLPEGTHEARLVFGGGRADRPRYDLLALESRSSLPLSGDEAEKAIALLDPGQAAAASLGAVTTNLGFSSEPVLSFAMHAGAEIDRRVFSHRREIVVPPSPEGLSRIDLEAEDLALLKSDLADLRVVDADNRQWAYLTQPGSGRESLALKLDERRRDKHRSLFLLQIPNAPQDLTGLDVQTAERFFDRRYRLVAFLTNGEKRELARGRFFRRVGDPRPFTIEFPKTRVQRLVFEVADGDDAPLRLSRFTARFDRPHVFLTASPGTYDLLIGNPFAEMPRYELERARSMVLAVPATAVDTGPLEENPSYSTSRRLSAVAGTPKALLWSVLILAAVVLVALTLRAARHNPESE